MRRCASQDATRADRQLLQVRPTAVVNRRFAATKFVSVVLSITAAADSSAAAAEDLAGRCRSNRKPVNSGFSVHDVLYMLRGMQDNKTRPVYRSCTHVVSRSSHACLRVPIARQPQHRPTDLAASRFWTRQPVVCFEHRRFRNAMDNILPQTAKHCWSVDTGKLRLRFRDCTSVSVNLSARARSGSRQSGAEQSVLKVISESVFLFLPLND